MSIEDRPGAEEAGTGPNKAIAAPDPKPTRMERPEQQAGYVLAGVGLVAATALFATGVTNPILFVLGLAAAAALAYTARRGQRIVTAFVALATGFVMLNLLVELLFLLYGGWLMLRTSKAQAKVKASRPRMTPQQRREARAARAGSRRGVASGGAGEGSGGRRPRPNRRYTPPKTRSGRRR